MKTKDQIITELMAALQAMNNKYLNVYEFLRMVDQRHRFNPADQDEDYLAANKALTTAMADFQAANLQESINNSKLP